MTTPFFSTVQGQLCVSVKRRIGVWTGAGIYLFFLLTNAVLGLRLGIG